MQLDDKMIEDNPFNQGYYYSDELRNFGFKSIGENVMVAKSATIVGLSNISLGNNVRIDGQGVIAANSGSLEVGSYVHIGSSCYLACSGGITLSDFCGLSQGVRIYSISDDYSGESLTNPTIPLRFLNLKIASVLIGKHVIIGSGSVVLPGVTVCEGSSVGALSLVSKSLSEWGVYVGCPAKKIRNRVKNILDLEKELLGNY
jgi:acetyltransferase-like isoleucine patch superfamily enzyme